MGIRMGKYENKWLNLGVLFWGFKTKEIDMGSWLI
jgi:hypothetical protein